jgi:hypothetical protein
MHEIDKLINAVRSRKNEDKEKRQVEMDRRRNEVLRRIGQAARDCGLLEKQDKNEVSSAEDMLYDALDRANRVRISQAESMADLAELMADFESEPYWWEIKNKDGNTVWKGYAFKECVHHDFWVSHDGRFLGGDESGVEISVLVRRTCQGSYVASVKAESGVSIGISAGAQASVKAAFLSAYIAFFVGVCKQSIVADDVPAELVKKFVVKEGPDRSDRYSLTSSRFS